ncbi:MAG: hypothetical protein MAG795_00757 [Candidatus Woesearchaeota archaeon]|nr:hypothetical protein [Candidatus Woesearchaeota archaeon]
MLWYKEWGFHNNPFSIKPAAFNDNVVGYDLTEIFDKISQGEILFLEGKFGYGKTTILKHIISRFGGQREVAYYNCNRKKGDIEVESVLKGKFGFFGKLFLGTPNNMIFLLDEVKELSEFDQQEMLRLFSNGNLKSVVLFGPKFELVNATPDLKEKLVDNVIELTKLTEEEAIDLVRERIGDIKLVSDDIIKKVFKHTKKIPRVLLENLEDVCKYAAENNEEEVTEDHLKEVLGIKKSKKKKAKPKKKKKKKSKKKKEKAQEEKENEKEKPKKPKTPNEIAEEKEEAEFFYY